MDATQPRRTVDLPDAAARLGISRATAYRLAAAGRFPTPVIQAGRRKVVPSAALDALLSGAAATTPTTAEPNEGTAPTAA